ncbi:hypothetical protein PIB30_078443 [Stylosanthes scabra]|uniref:Aminotransferase-like plant mobile domain-containing protein n=1 Tax=Stylosanthes scabra TaxID=79078 RepID=A0ABU6ZPH0_9FABA|nr:hypothetical protein [Stylosanthes scabra]
MDPNELPMPPRLSQLPEERWFDNDNKKLAYDKRLSKMEILPPKLIGDGVLPDENTRSFGDSLTSKACAHSSTCVRGLSISIYLSDVVFPILMLLLGWDFLNLQNEGITFKGGNNPHGTWNEFNKLDVIRGLWLEHAAPRKYAINRMSTDHRLLLYVLSYMLLPRKSNHGSASEEDLLILWAMVQEKQIHWPYLIAHRMLRYSRGKPTSFLAHAYLWMRIFEIAPLDLTREDDVEPKISHAISSKNIYQMRRNLVDHVGVAKDAGVDAMADAQPQVETDAPAQIPIETGVPPQFQPDIAEFVRKGFEDMRSMMTEGFARLSDHIDRLDTHMISQDTDLRNLRDEFLSFHGERMYVDFQEQPEDTPMQD